MVYLRIQSIGYNTWLIQDRKLIQSFLAEDTCQSMVDAVGLCISSMHTSFKRGTVGIGFITLGN